MDEQSAVIAQGCTHLESGDRGAAETVLRSGYAFTPHPVATRKYSLREMTGVFLRDGFIDRYSGNQLVFPAVLRLISAELPEAFPFHRNWKMSQTHPAYWDLLPTIDHLTPGARGGLDEDSNWNVNQHGAQFGQGCINSRAAWLDVAPAWRSRRLGWVDGLVCWLHRAVARAHSGRLHPELAQRPEGQYLAMTSMGFRWMIVQRGDGRTRSAALDMRSAPMLAGFDVIEGRSNWAIASSAVRLETGSAVTAHRVRFRHS